MSGEPAMMVRLLVDSTEELLMHTVDTRTPAQIEADQRAQIAAFIERGRQAFLAKFPHGTLAGSAPRAKWYSLGTLEERLAAWHSKAYPRKLDVRCPAGVMTTETYNKAESEWDELYEAWRKGDEDQIAIEAADVVICLFHFVRGFGRSLGDAILAKVDIIEKRLVDPQYGRKPQLPPATADISIDGTHI